MSKPREYTTEEIRKKFLRHVWNIIDYWEKESQTPDLHGKMTGLTFSLLSALDGCSINIPGFIVAPSSHPDDKKFHIDSGENYFPQNHEAAKAIKGDIGGCLHELFYKFDPSKKR